MTINPDLDSGWIGNSGEKLCEKCGQEVIDGHWSLVCHKPACIKALQEEEVSMSYDLPIKRCFNLEDHPEHSWEYKDELHKCLGMPIQVNKWGGTQQREDLKSCPFCGTKAISQGRLADNSTEQQWRIQCGNPFCTVQCVTQTCASYIEAVKCWQTRS